jgi:exodeoxyribonuclease-3
VNLRLLTYNIRFGGGGREEALTDTIRAAAPDLVVFQEATRPEVIQRLAAATGMTTWAAEHFQSVAFMTRLDVAHHGWFRPPPCRRAFLEIALTGASSPIFGVHLSAAHTNWMEGRRVREMRAMLAVIAARQHGFHVLAGDFNTLAPGERLDLGRLPLHLRLLARIGGPTIRWRTVQIMIDAGYADAYRVLHPGAEGETFPTWSPQMRLDYVFVPANAIERVRHCEIEQPPRARAASDHFPVLAEIEL